MIFDETACTLGEGPLWHPDRQSLIWFDIVNRRMFERPLKGARRGFDLPKMASAAGLVDGDRVLVATSEALVLMSLQDGRIEPLVALEADNPVTRSNDGRADPQGGFWIGTMGRDAEAEAGAIWRYHRGELRRLFAGLTIPNAICFSPEGDLGHFADTERSRIWQVRLDRDGWPQGDPQPFIDLEAEGLNPDGAVIDAEGGLWSAQWGASRVARYDRRGRFDRAIDLPARQVSCPAFGGVDLTTLFATTACQGLDDPTPADGRTYAVPAGIAGQREHRVVLG